MVKLDGDVESHRATALAAPPSSAPLFAAFYGWDPIPPRTPENWPRPRRACAGCCAMRSPNNLSATRPGLTSLAEDWRKLLFPHRHRRGIRRRLRPGRHLRTPDGPGAEITLTDGIEEAAKTLRKSNSLIGSALRLLTEEVDEEHTLDTSLKTLTAVLDVVDWRKLSKGEPEAWLYFYELFLHPTTRPRKKTGLLLHAAGNRHRHGPAGGRGAALASRFNLLEGLGVVRR